MAISSNWGTAKSITKTQLGRSREVDDQIVGAELANAINFYRPYDFWFLRRVESFALVADQESYAIGASPGPGNDVVKITRARLIDADDSTTFYTVEELNTNQFREHQRCNTTTGTPQVFAWEYDTTDDSNYTIAFSPVPDDTHSFEYDYVADIGTPGVKMDGSDVLITDPDDRTTAISDSYSNFWFTRAMDLITARALSKIFSRYLYNREQAEIFKAEEYEALRQIEARSLLNNNNTITPYFS